MKKMSIAFAALVSAAVALPAAAGPDWNVIREAEAHKALHQNSAATRNLPVEEPLDHGPRALSTPWLNEEHAAELLAQHKQDAAAASHAAHAPRSAAHS